MNERIKELAEQAREYIDSVCDPRSGVFNGKEYLEAVEEKFAELIIKECARVDSEENNPDHVDGETYNQTILQHFGVKG